MLSLTEIRSRELGLVLSPTIFATTGPQFSHLLNGDNNTFLTGRAVVGIKR